LNVTTALVVLDAVAIESICFAGASGNCKCCPAKYAPTAHPIAIPIAGSSLRSIMRSSFAARCTASRGQSCRANSPQADHDIGTRLQGGKTMAWDYREAPSR
jgi:hypothetical protein